MSEYGTRLFIVGASHRWKPMRCKGKNSWPRVHSPDVVPQGPSNELDPAKQVKTRGYSSLRQRDYQSQPPSTNTMYPLSSSTSQTTIRCQRDRILSGIST